MQQRRQKRWQLWTLQKRTVEVQHLTEQVGLLTSAQVLNKTKYNVFDKMILLSVDIHGWPVLIGSGLDRGE